MAGTGGDQQAPPDGEATATDVSIGPLADYLADGETVVYQLDGAADIQYEAEDGSESAVDAADPITVVTDRRVYFAALTDVGLDVAEIPYRNVRDVEASGGLLGRQLSVRVWDEGTYRFKPARGEPVEDAGAFVEEASTVWQRVLAAVEDARESITAFQERLVDGDETAAGQARETVRRELETARDRAERGPDEVAEALAARIDEVERELQRARVYAHVERGKALYEAAEGRADDEAWSDAETALQEAYRHVEIARKVAALGGFPVVEAIDREFEVLEERAADIAARPRKLGGLAKVTAEDADDPSEAVPAWASALDHFRAAVSFDWGGALGVERDTDTLREQVEGAAEGLIEARCALAEKLRGQADDARMAGNVDAAADHYEVALSQLAMAESVARELRAGDPGAIAAEREAIRERLDAVGGPRETESEGESDGESAVDASAESTEAEKPV